MKEPYSCRKHIDIFPEDNTMTVVSPILCLGGRLQDKKEAGILCLICI